MSVCDVVMVVGVVLRVGIVVTCLSGCRVVTMAVHSGGACFFFQAEDGIRDAQERGLGDVYKRQTMPLRTIPGIRFLTASNPAPSAGFIQAGFESQSLSLIHI